MELPDLFKFLDGKPVATGADWLRRRTELRTILLDIAYGSLPPAPPETRMELLHWMPVRQLEGVRRYQYRVFTNPIHPHPFMLDVFVPAGDGPFHVVLTGDACWRNASTDAVLAEVTRRRYILAVFNRVEIVPDVDGKPGIGDTAVTSFGPTCGALACWAWGYHRCVDVLTRLPFVDAAHVAIVGHSRGGKTTLLAGATDERISLTSANCSGCGGAGAFHEYAKGSETLADILRSFPFWFSDALREYIGQEQRLPFDQHFLKALVAPRLLLTTEGLGDLWTNPPGTWATHAAAREAYRFLGVEERIGVTFREGGHAHGIDDWKVLLDFADWQWRGIATSRRFDINPFATS